MDSCAGVELTCQQCEVFPSNSFTALKDATFVAVIGPSANPRGYTGITGIVQTTSMIPRLYPAAVYP